MRANSQVASTMHSGFLSLATILVMLALSTLSVLELTSARATQQLTNREALMLQEGYDAEHAAQQTLAWLEELLYTNTEQGASYQQGDLTRLLESALESQNPLESFTPEAGELSCTAGPNDSVYIHATTEHGRVLDATVVPTERGALTVQKWSLTTTISEDTSYVLYTEESEGN